MAFDATDDVRAFFKNGLEVSERVRGIETPSETMFLLDKQGNAYDMTGIAIEHVTVTLRCNAWGDGRDIKTGQACTYVDQAGGVINFQMQSATANDLPPGHDVYVQVIIDVGTAGVGVGLINPSNYPVLRIKAK